MIAGHRQRVLDQNYLHVRTICNWELYRHAVTGEFLWVFVGPRRVW